MICLHGVMPCTSRRNSFTSSVSALMINSIKNTCNVILTWCASVLSCLFSKLLICTDVENTCSFTVAMEDLTKCETVKSYIKTITNVSGSKVKQAHLSIAIFLIVLRNFRMHYEKRLLVIVEKGF